MYNSDLDKIVKLATKVELKTEQDKIVKLQAFDSSCFSGKSYFEDDGKQKYLVFQLVHSFFKRIANSDHILAWKSETLSDESIKPPTASNNSLTPALNHINTKLRVKFDESCLKQEKVTFTHKKVVNICIVYEINLWPYTLVFNFTLSNSVF